MRSLAICSRVHTLLRHPLETPCLSLCTQAAVVSGKLGGAPRALAAGSAAWSQGGASAGSAAAAARAAGDPPPRGGSWRPQRLVTRSARAGYPREQRHVRNDLSFGEEEVDAAACLVVRFVTAVGALKVPHVEFCTAVCSRAYIRE